LQEVGILKSLNYDRNIVQFYGACLQEGSDPMLVCEFMEGGC
jgi:serine/threonine protein kinase